MEALHSLQNIFFEIKFLVNFWLFLLYFFYAELDDASGAATSVCNIAIDKDLLVLF